MEAIERARAREVISEIASYDIFTKFKVSSTATLSGAGLLYINRPGGNRLTSEQVAIAKQHRDLIIRYMLTPPPPEVTDCRSSNYTHAIRWFCNCYGIWICECYKLLAPEYKDDLWPIDLLDDTPGPDELPAPVLVNIPKGAYPLPPKKKSRYTAPRKVHRKTAPAPGSLKDHFKNVGAITNKEV